MPDTSANCTRDRLNQQEQGHIHIYYNQRIYMDMPLFYY